MIYLIIFLHFILESSKFLYSLKSGSQINEPSKSGRGFIMKILRKHNINKSSSNIIDKNSFLTKGMDYDQYIKLASTFVTDEEKKYRLANKFYTMDVQKFIELKDALRDTETSKKDALRDIETSKKDARRDTETSKKDALRDIETSKKDALRDVSKEYKNKEAYLLSKISEISQRFIVEEFFRDFVDYLLKDEDSSIARLVKKKNQKLYISWTRNNNPVDPKMSDINRLLLDDEICNNFFEYKNIQDLVFPIFDKYILYGTLFEIILHEPVLSSVIIASDLSEDNKIFFIGLATKYKMNITVYDAADAILGKRYLPHL